ncbi:hypothetical protein JXA88_08560 [Candidatus Fermentibacteria bacterium]|nr:hypothetical protein [Candidatus Fermentibacteria bacterium]
MRRKVLSAVRQGEGWRVLTIRRDSLGWRMANETTVPGETVSDLLSGLQPVASPDKVLAVGLDRDRLIVRSGERGSAADRALPSGVELVVWERNARDGTAQVREAIASPRGQVRQIIQSAHAAGFGETVVFPVWVAAIQGAPRQAKGAMLTWPAGGVTLEKGGWGPWRDASLSGEGEPTGIVPSLRGGAAFALSRVPEGWSSARPGSRLRPSMAAVVLAVSVLAWGGARWHWIHRETAAVERQAAEATTALYRAESRGCSVAEGARFLVQASSCASEITLSRMLQDARTVTLTGHGESREAVETLRRSLGADLQGLAVWDEGRAVAFRMEIPLSCAH